MGRSKWFNLSGSLCKYDEASTIKWSGRFYFIMFTFRLLVFSTIVTLILLTPFLTPDFVPIATADLNYDIQFSEECRAGVIILSLVLVHHLGR